MGFNTFPCNPYPISTEELNKGNNDDLNTRVTALEGEVSDLNSTKANQITIAPFFNAEASYSVGDLVYYNGLTYRCTNDHEGEWDADDFAATTISGELDTLKSGLTNKTELKTEIMILDIGSDGLFTIPAALFSDNVQHRVICIQPSQWWHKSIILGGPDGNGCQGWIDVSENTSLQCYVTYIVT